MTEITRPQPPSARGSTSSEIRPEDYNPEMAAASMAKDLVNRMGTPAILSQKFVVWHGITRALNHTKENPTGIDTSLRLEIYDHAAKNSVNVDGRYFTAVWTYLNKPNLTVVQPGQLPGNSFQDDQPSLGRRILNKFTGGGNNGQPNNTQ